MANIESEPIQFDPQGWCECRASLEEMVGARGFDLQRLQQEAGAYLRSLCWPEGVRCPYPACGSANVQAAGDHEPMPYRCQRCRRHFSALSATILSSFELDDLQLLAATYVTVAHHGLVRATPLAEWLDIDERTARLLIELIEAVSADEPPALPAASTDAVAQTRSVLSIILYGDRAGDGVVIAATGEEPDWRVVLRKLDPVLWSQREPTLPGIGPRVVPRRLAGPAKKKSKPRQPRTPEPKARGMRPDQPPIPDFEARLRRKRGSA